MPMTSRKYSREVHTSAMRPRNVTSRRILQKTRGIPARPTVEIKVKTSSTFHHLYLQTS